MKNIILFTLIILTWGCSSVKKTAESVQTNTVQKDTVYISKIKTVKDTVFKMKADSSMFEALIECDSNNQAFIREITTMKNGKKIQTNVVFKDRKIYIKSKINEDSLRASIERYYEDKYKGTEATSATVTDKSFIKKASAFAWLKWLLIGIVAGILIRQLAPLILKAVKTII